MKNWTLLFILTLPTLFGATSVSDDGFTWTFADDETVGQYANGDWWVVGPVTITSITPASVNDAGWNKNGTMLTPQIYAVGNANNNKQGFDNNARDIGYLSALNVSPNRTGSNLVVSEGTVVSSESLNNPVSSGVKGRPQVKRVAYLTVVASQPASGAFRPSPVGASKVSNWNESDLDYSILQSFTPPASYATYGRTLTQSTNDFKRPWIEFGVKDSYTERAIHPQDNQPDYGREISNEVQHALFNLNLNHSNAEKRDLFVYLVQYGIDIYGSAQAGKVWKDLGGHLLGRKAALMLAAYALDDAGMKAYLDAGTHFIFQEDRQTFYISQSDVDDCPKYSADGRPRDCYTPSMIGTAEWGEQHTKQRERDGSNWNAFYRQICHNTWFGHALAAHWINGAVAQWNHDAFFDYMDRVVTIETVNNGSTNGMDQYEKDMWTSYRNSGGGTPTSPTPLANPAGGTYPGTQSVTLTATGSDSIRYTTDGSTPTGSSTLYSGPISVSSSQTIKSISITAGESNSGVISETYTIGTGSGVTSTINWQNVVFNDVQSENFTYTVDATPNAANMDGVIGLSQNVPSAYGDLSAIVRFNTSGNIDVRNGSSYTADATYSYTNGTEYEIEMVIDMAANTYTVSVTSDPNGSPGTKTAIATDFNFRTDSPNPSTLGYTGYRHESGSHTLDNITLSVSQDTADAPTWAGITPGAYSEAQSVTITTNEVGGTTRYTTDGSEVDSGDTVYSGAINVASTTTIRARTFKAGENQSVELTGTFTIDEVTVDPETVETVVVDIPGGNYGTTQNLTPSTTTEGATIYYTTDGSTPTTSSTQYTSGTIAISTATALKLLGVKAGFTDSLVSTYNYTIGGGNPDPDKVPVNSGGEFTTVVLSKSYTGRAMLIDQIIFTNTDTEAYGGLGLGDPGTDSDLALAWRTATGNWQARNGSTWAAENTVAITAAAWQIRYEKKPSSYSLYVRLASTAPNGAWSQIANNYSYSAPHTIDRASYRSELRSITVGRDSEQIVRVSAQ